PLLKERRFEIIIRKKEKERGNKSMNGFGRAVTLTASSILMKCYATRINRSIYTKTMTPEIISIRMMLDIKQWPKLLIYRCSKQIASAKRICWSISKIKELYAHKIGIQLFDFRKHQLGAFVS